VEKLALWILPKGWFR